MKRLVVTASILILVTLGTPVVLPLTNSLAEIQQTRRYQLPKGDWTLACHPVSKSGPVVDLYTVKTESSKGLTITQVEISNQSNRHVASVEIRWRLYLQDRPDITLLEGRTPFLDVSLAPRHRRTLKYPVVCFADIWRSLAKDGELNGNLHIEVDVRDITFDPSAAGDQENERNQHLIKKVSWQIGDICDTGDCTSTGACQNQICLWVDSRASFICEVASGFTCRVVDSNNCTDGRCRTY